MADIIIHVTGMGALEGTSDVYVGGDCRTSDMETADPSIAWSAQVSPSDLAATVNTAIKNAAIAAAANEGHTVGILDKKTVLGGATGL